MNRSEQKIWDSNVRRRRGGLPGGTMTKLCDLDAGSLSSVHGQGTRPHMLQLKPGVAVNNNFFFLRKRKGRDIVEEKKEGGDGATGLFLFFPNTKARSVICLKTGAVLASGSLGKIKMYESSLQALDGLW